MALATVPLDDGVRELVKECQLALALMLDNSHRCGYDCDANELCPNGEFARQTLQKVNELLEDDNSVQR